MAEQCEVLVIGGDRAGYAAASTAARLGKRVAMAERGKLGGTCRNRFFNRVQYCTATPPAVCYLPDVSAAPCRRMLSLCVGRIVGGIIIEALAGKTAGRNVDGAVMTAEVKTK